MRNKLFKRIAVFLLATLMSFANMSMAFATETSAEVLDMEAFGEVTMLQDGTDITTFANSPVTGTVSANSSINLYFWLESYIGVSKKLIVNATSESTSGALFLYLYNPSGKLVSKDWIMGVNEIVKWSVTLPSSGKWRLWVVASGTNASVDVYTKWE